MKPKPKAVAKATNEKKEVVSSRRLAETEIPNQKVTLETTDLEGEQKTYEFSISVAEKILNLSNSKWILKDDNFDFVDGEIVPKGPIE